MIRSTRFLGIVSFLGLFWVGSVHASTCAVGVAAHAFPRQVEAEKTFNALVDWIHDDLIIAKGAPGFVVGLSGTDSILVYLAAVRAFEKAGRPDRVVGIHYGGKDSSPFQEQVIPWLRRQAPSAQIRIDNSIEGHRDGMRWGMLLDWSVIEDMATGAMRPRQQSYWVLGTRNATENELGTYSNISASVSAQPIIHLWKSEVLQLCRHLRVPQVAIAQSCVQDCVCGRHELAALHINQIDALLMLRRGELEPGYIASTVPEVLRERLSKYIDEQTATASFKTQIPYTPEQSPISLAPQLLDQLYMQAKGAIAGGDFDTRPISRVVPYIMDGAHANMAAALMGTPGPRREGWLPEAMMLLGTPGLQLPQKRQMVESIFGNDLSTYLVRTLARLSSRIAEYGFDFPQWRFLARNYADKPSLAEQFGMRRVTQSDDFLNASLPMSDPNRDYFGTAFVVEMDKWKIEYRRAYVAISDGETKLTIRNNSYYFGRDRLKHPATVEWNGEAIPFQDLLRSNTDVPIPNRLRRIEAMLSELDVFNLAFNRWMLGGPLQDLLQHHPELFVTQVQGSKPSWLPTQVVSGSEFTNATFSPTPDSRIVLMRGADGDYP